MARILTSSKVNHDDLVEFLKLVKSHRAIVNDETTAMAMSHRGLVRCLNEGGEVLNDMEEVASKGPVIEFSLTSRGRLSSMSSDNQVPGSSDSPWPARDIVEKLVEAANLLLDTYDYDSHGWEEIHGARSRAIQWLKRPHKP